MTQKIGLKYTGNGTFIVGVPAMDLTPQQVKIYGKKLLLDSGLYSEPKPQAKKEKGK